jgi:pilus assembly protein CpaC
MQRHLESVGHAPLYGWFVALLLVAAPIAAPAAQTDSASEAITLVAGRSTVIKAPWPTVRVAVTDPTVADVQVLTPDQVLVQGLKVGSTDLILWSDDEQKTWQQRVIVRMDAQTIRGTLRALFPTAAVDVNESGEILLVRGSLRSADQAEQLKEYLEKTKSPYVNMTTLSGVQQVQLQVRVAEVSRAAVKALGVNAFGTGSDFFFGQRVGTSAGGALVPSINIGAAGDQLADDSLAFVTPQDGIGVSPLVTIFAGFPNADLEVFFLALAENQYMRVLANPTLIALSGEEAHFLAGGEFPIPVVQGTVAGGSNAITIEWKQFGVLLTFRPTVLGDGRIRLRAMQEVSELTDIGALVIQGFTIPALTTRRAEATMELSSGQSFAMAGLLQNMESAANSRIPGLGDLPVIGPLFRSVRYRTNETELVILVTASLVEPMSLAQTPPLPGASYVPPNDWELYMEGRLAGKAPARLDPASAEWLREMGLDQLVGPGAWDTYEDPGYSTTQRAAPPARNSEGPVR